MKPGIIPITIGFIILGVLFSGCTSPSGTAPATIATPSLVSTTAPATTVVPLTTSTDDPANKEVQSLPAAQQIHLDLTKDRPTSEIRLSYQGGPGDIFTQKIEMRVFSSTAEYKEYVMSGGKKPIPGDDILAPGTRGSDRCMVFVTSGGKRYKVLDEPAVVGSY